MRRAPTCNACSAPPSPSSGEAREEIDRSRRLPCETIYRMDVDHPERDQSWDERARQESATERLDRNWSSLLQELRVVQTGVQLLTGFLLTLPFQQRFDQLPATMRVIYLVTTACSVAATVLLIAPVGLHRMLFRQRRLQVLVSVAHRFAYGGLLMLGVALTGVVIVVFDAVAGSRTALIAGTVAGSGFLAFWLVLPLAVRIGGTRRPPP